MEVRSLLEALPRDPRTGCWLWQGAKRQGYGAFGWAGKSYETHRLAYELFRGVKPGKRFVCHRCDVRACCNPDHLFLGDQGDNVRDMHMKGRGRSRLTAVQVLEIRSRTGEVQTVLAREYGVSQGAISRIQRGAGWRMLGEEPARIDLRATLTEEQIRLIRYWAAYGTPMPYLAKRFGVSYPTIFNIVKRKSWKHVA